MDKGVAGASRGEHLCVLFDCDTKRDEVSSAFVRDGLARDEKVLCFTDRRDPADVFRAWALRGIDVDRATRLSQVAVATAAESYLASGTFDPDTLIPQWSEQVSLALRAGFSGLRVIGAMDWATRGVAGAEHFNSYEHRIQHEIFPNFPLTGLCEFDMRHFRAEDVDMLIDLHPDGNLLPEPLWKNGVAALDWTFEPLGLKASGVIDIYNRGGFDDALAQLGERTEGDVTLDLAQVTYLDARTMVMIARAANKLSPQRKLVVHNMAPVLRRCMDILRLSTTPGLLLSA